MTGTIDRRVWIGIHQIINGSAREVVSATRSDEIVVAIVIESAHYVRLKREALRVELWRGDEYRSSCDLESPFEIDSFSIFLFDVSWSDRQSASPRLIARVMSGEIELAHATFVAVPGIADAQGRIDRFPIEPPSQATRIAIERAFQWMIER